MIGVRACRRDVRAGGDHLSFAPFVSSGTGLNPLAVATADFDGDGRRDLATANLSEVGSVSVLLGNDDGTFKAKVDYPVNQPRRAPGLAVTNSANADGTDGRLVSVLLGRGDGTFAPKVDYPTSLGPLGLAVADLNADGNPDMAITDRGANTVSLLMGRGNVTFAPPAAYYDCRDRGPGARLVARARSCVLAGL